MEKQTYSPYLHLYGAFAKMQITGIVKNLCIEEEIQNLEQIYLDWENATTEMRKIEASEGGITDNNSLFPIEIPIQNLMK